MPVGKVGVFTALSRGNDTALIDGELFVPKDWFTCRVSVTLSKRIFRLSLSPIWVMYFSMAIPDKKASAKGLFKFMQR